MSVFMFQDPLYQHIFTEVEHVHRHISWVARYYYTWNILNSPLLYLNRPSWSFMRTSIRFVTETWAQLNTLVERGRRRELKALLQPLEDQKPIWEMSKKFLGDVIERSELFYAQNLIDDDVDQ
ncbi:uncharacterized protein LOC118513843 [Anopheles stephensi]|uniref:uncharacterized protein LOC118513843 n=1 Tax=Anopheles stephensi TaxID=30069 RepID=UPI00165881E9|nr:uncharacterized protein LOC118513843 [Anopheles stephensi]